MKSSTVQWVSPVTEKVSHATSPATMEWKSSGKSWCHDTMFGNREKTGIENILNEVHFIELIRVQVNTLI